MAYTGYILVRDKDGNVKFDDWSNIHQGYWEQLTDADKAYIMTKRGK